MHFFYAWEPVMKRDTILLNVKIAFETGYYLSRDSCELLAFIQESLRLLIADRWLAGCTQADQKGHHLVLYSLALND